jgi:hypothetical protein
MFFSVLLLSRKVLHSFDWWGQPVAPLNMRGKTVFTTSVGGIAGVLISVLILWFSQTKIMKMINLNDPFNS